MSFLKTRIKTFIKIHGLLKKGARINKPSSIEIRGQIDVEKNVIIDNNVIFKGKVILSKGVKISSNCILSNCTIGPDTYIKSNSLVDGCEIGPNSIIGPFGRIRPDSTIGSNAQIGNFVEIKNSKIGVNCRINHLSFIGDTIIGNDVTIGAGVVTCNSDGVSTKTTYIDDKAFIGSGVFLVAPVRILNGATIGAGSVITKDVPSEKLTLARSRQVTVENWKKPKN